MLRQCKQYWQTCRATSAHWWEVSKFLKNPRCVTQNFLMWFRSSQLTSTIRRNYRQAARTSTARACSSNINIRTCRSLIAARASCNSTSASSIYINFNLSTICCWKCHHHRHQAIARHLVDLWLRQPRPRLLASKVSQISTNFRDSFCRVFSSIIIFTHAFSMSSSLSTSIMSLYRSSQQQILIHGLCCVFIPVWLCWLFTRLRIFPF